MCGVVPRPPPTGCRYSIVLGGGKQKSRCRCLHFIPHIHTPKKMASFTATVRIWIIRFLCKRARRISHGSRSLMRARADVFFFFLSRVNLQPTGIDPFTRVAKINRVSQPPRETEDAKLTFKIISSHHNRPPNSRSSRLFPVNSRTAPSPRYALFERF